MKQKKIINANTFTPLYDEMEDRLKVVINYQDLNNRVDLMITRAFILKIIPSIDEFMMKHYSYEDEFIEENTVETPLEQHNEDQQQTLSKTNNENLALLQKEKELLLQMDISYDNKSKNSTLKFTTQNYIIVSTLNEELFKQIVSIIKKSIPYIKWGISRYF
ncbi:MAG: hypothetical protein U9Q33_11960 [Campylobacterota bacterium]|nr:hypothetical protein [Campylobacterota bacterium]